MSDFPVIIIGGGVAGLTCANYLHRKNIDFLLLESTAEVGGRVQTDSVDGYLLDRGFQVLQTNYPEAKQVLNYEDLNLKSFKSGAKIRSENGFITMQNPFRNPLALLPMAFSGVGSLVDKLKVAQLIAEIRTVADEALLAADSNTSTLEFLQNYGFSDKIIRNFFRPFFGGVFLEEELTTASNFFKFTFKQFFAGDVALPETGMKQIPQQLRNNLPENSIQVNSAVDLIEKKQLKLADGTTLTANKIVVATNPTIADKLLNRTVERKFNNTTCLYFSADFSPMSGKKYLTLNPNRRQLVHHLCVPSDISAAYAPTGKTLISVTLRSSELNKTKQVEQTKRELSEWFGSSVNAWRLLGEYRIPEAVSTYEKNTIQNQYQVTENILTCGDYLAYPSLNGTMKTGREVAELLS